MVKLLSFSIFLLAFTALPRSFGQTEATKESLPSAPAGKEWNDRGQEPETTNRCSWIL